MIASILMSRVAVTGLLASASSTTQYTAAAALKLEAQDQPVVREEEEYREVRIETETATPPPPARPAPVVTSYEEPVATGETRIAPPTAADDDKRDYFRLRWDMVPLSYTYGRGWDDEDRPGENNRDSHTVTVLGGPPVQSSGGVRAGLGVASGLGLSLGYVWDDQLAIGTRFGAGWQYNSDDDSDASGHLVTYSIAPELDYMFRPGERFQPLVTARFGAVGSYQQVEDAAGNDIHAHTIGPLAGAGIGGAWWASSNVAFDTRIMFDYAPLWATGRTDDPADLDGYDRLSHNMSVSLVTGISFGPRSRSSREMRPD